MYRSTGSENYKQKQVSSKLFFDRGGLSTRGRGYFNIMGNLRIFCRSCQVLSNMFEGFPRNFLDLSKNFLDFSRNLEIPRKILKISRKILDISRKFLEISKNFVEIPRHL